MDRLITFQNKEEIHRITPNDSKQVVYFTQTYTLIESGISVFRNGLLQINDKDFFFLNRSGRKATALDKFVIGVCFYQQGTTFQTLLQENDYIVFKFSVLSPRVFDYDRITNTISEQYQRQIDGMVDEIYGINQTCEETVNTVSTFSATLDAHATNIGQNAANISAIESTLATMGDSIDDNTTNIGTNADDISTIQSDITTINETLEEISSAISSISLSLDDLTTQISSLVSRVNALEGIDNSGGEDGEPTGEGGENGEPSGNEEEPTGETEPEQGA